MMVKIHPIQTQVGFLEGRDCIFLDSAEKNEKNELILSGDINGSLCTQYEGKQKWIPYQATFRGVIAYQGCELDTYEQTSKTRFEDRSSFNELMDSDLLNNLDIRQDEDKASFHHYNFWTYDEVYDIIAQSFSLELEL